MHFVTRLDIKKYSCVTEGITTDEVIITDVQIQHIKERHPDAYQLFNEYLEEVIQFPDYIIEANRPCTALVLKEIQKNEEHIKLVLRLVTSADNPEYKNSIITFTRIDEKDWRRLLKNKVILYKRE